MRTGLHKGALYRGAGGIAACLVAAMVQASWPGELAAQAEQPAPEAPLSEQQQQEQRAMEAMDAEARQHFQLGRTFYDSGRFQQAVEEFQAAYKLSGRPQLLYNVYVAERDAGHLQSAVDALRGYLEQVPDAPDRVNLRARLESLEAQAKRQAEQDELARQAAEKAANQPPATRTEVKHSMVPWILVGTGGALVLSSVVTGVLAKNKADDLDEACGGSSCPSSEQSNVDSTRTLAITTDVLWSVGAATAITGVVLWLTGALDEERQVPVAVGVSPSLVGNGLSTTFSGRF